MHGNHSSGPFLGRGSAESAALQEISKYQKQTVLQLLGKTEN